MPQLPSLSAAYAAAVPYPHTVLDDLLSDGVVDKALEEFIALDGDGWLRYSHINEQKLARRDIENFGPVLRSIVDELSGPRFVSFLEQLTGIAGLVPDPTLEGGGLHQTLRGGFLNIHVDFSTHPHRHAWRRRLNVLVYLNRDWREEYGGALEMWDASVSRCTRAVTPNLNRCVIFSTDERSFHGHPEPLECPANEARRSLALYYYTVDDGAAVRPTTYRPRQVDGLRRMLIAADNLALRLYDDARRRWKFKDSLGSRILGLLWRRR